MPLAENGDAIGVYEEENIGKALDALLNNKDDILDKMRKRQNSNINNYIYKLDGNAYNRIAQVITRLTKTTE